MKIRENRFACAHVPAKHKIVIAVGHRWLDGVETAIEIVLSQQDRQISAQTDQPYRATPACTSLKAAKAFFADEQHILFGRQWNFLEIQALDDISEGSSLRSLERFFAAMQDEPRNSRLLNLADRRGLQPRPVGVGVNLFPDIRPCLCN